MNTRQRSLASLGASLIIILPLMNGCGGSSSSTTSPTAVAAATATGTTATSASELATRPPQAENKVLVKTPGFDAENAKVPVDRVVNLPPKPSSRDQAEMAPTLKRILGSDIKQRNLWMAGEALVDAGAKPKVKIQTSKGSFTVQVQPKGVPITVANFLGLAMNHFYDGLTFHRYEPGFVIQGGDPQGTGLGGPGYHIADEHGPMVHDEGVIAMAKSAEPNSAGSQFYITLAPAHNLDMNYTVFGKVISGMDVVRNLRKGDRILHMTVSDLPKSTPIPDPRHA